MPIAISRLIVRSVTPIISAIAAGFSFASDTLLFCGFALQIFVAKRFFPCYDYLVPISLIYLCCVFANSAYQRLDEIGTLLFRTIHFTVVFQKV
jgi:hypothetical protein